MKQYSIHKEGNRINLILRVTPVSVFIRSTLLLLISTSIGLPVVGIVFRMIQGLPPRLSAFILWAILIGCGVYLLRIYLWNTCGKEVFEINLNKVSYHADYGWFGDAKNTIESSKGFEFNIKDSEGLETKQFVIEGEDSTIISAIKLPISELNEILNELSQS